MKSNSSSLVLVGLICAIFLVVSWRTAAAGRAQLPQSKGTKATQERKDNYDRFNPRDGGHFGGGGGYGNSALPVEETKATKMENDYSGFNPGDGGPFGGGGHRPVLYGRDRRLFDQCCDGGDGGSRSGGGGIINHG